jgi:hypothetical protein
MPSSNQDQRCLTSAAWTRSCEIRRLTSFLTVHSSGKTRGGLNGA